jgi:predicted N-acyltransferase
VPQSSRIDVFESFSQLDAGQWNALSQGRHPFLRYEFLNALENSGSACTETGWTPRHLVLRDQDGTFLAALPLYLKSHSWGEFVFDQSWAQAYHQAGLNYYPRLVAGIPFTPVVGPRVLCRPDQDRQDVTSQLLEKAQQVAVNDAASSIHILFPEDAECKAYDREDLLARHDCQFHWHNHGYQDFDDFLNALTSSRRKKLKRERRRVLEAGFTFKTIEGQSIEPELLDTVYLLHASTFAARRQTPYLSHGFFKEIIATMADAIVLLLAIKDGIAEACAICFRDAETLYGRYWGARNYHDSLHFETCYYQGIDYCIRNGLRKFEPGAQGEHKLTRGFEPTVTHSFHWLANPVFFDAIGNHLERERHWVKKYLVDARGKLPFRQASIEEKP